MNTDVKTIYNSVAKKKEGICVRGNQWRPEIYYIGNGKTGSSSVMKGFDQSVAHWHNEGYFEKIYGEGIFESAGICLYDLVIYCGSFDGNKPLIVESYRDPIATTISYIGQFIHNKKLVAKNTAEFLKLARSKFLEPTGAEMRNRVNPYSLRWKDYFGVDLLERFDNNKGYLYEETENARLLFLRLENSDKWKDIFTQHTGYKYTSNFSNSANKRGYASIYQKALQQFCLSERYLEEFYDNPIIRTMYTDKEIEEFVKRWKE